MNSEVNSTTCESNSQLVSVDVVTCGLEIHGQPKNGPCVAVNPLIADMQKMRGISLTGMLLCGHCFDLEQTDDSLIHSRNSQRTGLPAALGTHFPQLISKLGEAWIRFARAWSVGLEVVTAFRPVHGIPSSILT
jgi:hypothetical protein